MAYPALGIVVTLGVLIGSAILYYVSNRNSQTYSYNNNYNSDHYYPLPSSGNNRSETTPRSGSNRRRRKPRNFETNADCAICLCDIRGDKHILNCGHAYHQDCISKWFSNGALTCPICRMLE